MVSGTEVIVRLGLTRSYRGADYDTVLDRTRAALSGEGFGVLTEIDVQATLREKLGESLERYVILGACNPSLAHRALQASRDIGLLLPCNVVVRQDEADSSVTRVEAVNPAMMSELVAAAEIEAVAGSAAERLESALTALDEALS